jgi:preprotein translocase subunit SecY
MESFFKKLKILYTDKSLRNKILFVVLILAIFRVLAVIPVPGIDTARLARFFSGNQFLTLFNTLSGGGFSHFSIVMLGVGPYITASIIMQLLSMMWPRLKELMQESGEIGRKKFNQYTRMIAVPIAFLQGIAFLRYLQTQGVVDALSFKALIGNAFIIVAGSMLLLWLAELINEFGIGNGTSLIIMSGIVSVIPEKISQFLFTYTADQLPVTLLYLALGFLVIAGVVYIYEAQRPVEVTYARQARGIRMFGSNETYIPLRLTQAGVMPIIFASSLLLFPQFIANFLANSASHKAQAVSHALLNFLQSNWQYAIVYFLLVVFFTYFYTAITFDPKQMAENLQKNGAFIPGIRPGESTRSHIADIVTKLTLVGSLFLGIVAVLPLVVRGTTGITAFAVGGTSLLITVSVVIDLIRKVDAQVAMQE